MRDKEEKGGKWEEGEEEEAKDRPWDCSLATRSACSCAEPRTEGSNIEGESFEHHMAPHHGHSTGGLTSRERPGRRADTYTQMSSGCYLCWASASRLETSARFAS